jgi:hypothetical protein
MHNVRRTPGLLKLITEDITHYQNTLSREVLQR